MSTTAKRLAKRTDDGKQPHNRPGESPSSPPWAGRVSRTPDGLAYMVRLTDGAHYRVSAARVESDDRTVSLPPEGVAWLVAVRATYARDAKATNYYSLYVGTVRLRKHVGRFLADHYPPCACGVCDLLATMDADDPDGSDGSRVKALAHRLFALLAECELAFGNLNHDPFTGH